MLLTHFIIFIIWLFSNDIEYWAVLSRMEQDARVRNQKAIPCIRKTDPRSSCVSANNGRRGSASHEEYYKSFSNFEHTEEVNANGF